VVKPSWEEYASRPGDLVLELDPGMAFGTGAHPTTQPCVELLMELERGSVVDLGCGSGVLSIAAAKLGFAPVIALDSDEAAVEATRANAEANDVEVQTSVADILATELPRTDVAVANITRPTLEAIAPAVRSRRLIGSGYLPTDGTELVGYRHVRRVTRDSWAADLYEAAE